MPKVVRSPNYPVVSLAEAVARVKAIYDKEHAFPAPREAVARDIGYGTLNGASASMISALTKYGLLESIGQDQVKVTADAVDILLHMPGEPERVEAVQRAALRPALFNDLHTVYGDGDSLPSDHTIGVYLQKKGFNPNTLSSVIRSYRDTIEFVKTEIAAQGAEMATEELHVDAMPRSRVPSQPRTPGLGLNASGRSEAGMRLPVTPVQQPLSSDNSASLSFNLARDCGAKIFFTGHVTQEAIRKLIALLDLSVDTFPSKARAHDAVEETTVEWPDVPALE